MKNSKVTHPCEIEIQNVVHDRAHDKAHDRAHKGIQEFTESMISIVVKKVKKKLNNLKIQASNLALVIRYTMECIEKTSTKGVAQTYFALCVISELISELLDSDEKNFLQQSLDNGGIKNTIELVVSATHGDININKVAEVIITKLEATRQVKEKLGFEKIQLTNLSLAIKYTMECVEKTQTKGSARMNCALQIIGDLISDLPNSDEKKFLQQSLDNGGIKNTIELLIKANNGEINVNKIAGVTATSCLGPCFTWCRNKCT